MKKFATWVLDHLKLVFTILTFGIALIVVGIVMISSYTSYKAYEANFRQNDLDTRSLSAAQPASTELVESFKSQFGNKYSFNADDLTVTASTEDYLVDDYIDLTQTGGTISAAVTIEKKAFVDIVFTISSEYKTTGEDGDVYGVKDLLSNIGIVVNGERMEDVVDLPNSGSGPEWYQLVMADFAIPEGKVEVTISSTSGKNAMMPQLKGITFYSSQKLSLYEAEEA